MRPGFPCACFVLGCLAGACDQVASPPLGPEYADVVVPEFSAQQLPTSDRFEAVRERVAPKIVAELDKLGLRYGAPVYMRIFKEERELECWLEDDETFRLFRKYPIACFSGELGPKLCEGDRQAPEGFYFVPPSRLNPHSRFHLSFNLGYPNRFDRAHGRTGSALMVHGNCVSIGCYAMTDPLIEEIYVLAAAALANGQPFFRVHAFPFRMDEDNMRRHAGSRWMDFWRNCAEGYQFFEEFGRPPDVTVRSGRYCFASE